jgi:hypothetical protein
MGAQAEVLEVLPKLPSPVLSLEKANIRRLKNPLAWISTDRN